ncbi:MAG: TVP38/TMEM64 family protein [Imperialibacter sp.]|uniref:TVP38/TMEM64 family protein n=1 Tax=Imperialibacter sp. TaxID=2038411 RepID=UPI003A8AEAB5
MRLLYLFLALAAIVLISFFIWGDPLMETFSMEGSVNWLSQYGSWAWAMGIVLLMGDLLLPLPATLVMSALGYIYGPVVGGLISAAGSFITGSFGYWLCRLMGEKAAIKLLGAKDYEKGKKLSGKIGGWVVVLSRWLPVFPEVISCMAGMVRMNATHFHLALASSAIPMGFVFAFIGSAGTENPTIAVILSAGLPPLIWLAIRPIFKARLTA